jgi:hypothetical protein
VLLRLVLWRSIGFEQLGRANIFADTRTILNDCE